MRYFSVMLLLMLAPCAIPSINPPPQGTADRSWVPNDAVIYGADQPHGFFHFALNQPQPETLVNSPGPDELTISPNKTEIYVETQVRHFLYNTQTGAPHDLGALIPPYSMVQISPDWHYISWTSAYHPGLYVVDLRSSTVRAVKLPGEVTQRDSVADNFWSSDGDVLVTLRHGQGSSSYWKIAPATGAITQIEGQMQTGMFTFSEDGKLLDIFPYQPSGIYSYPGKPIAAPSGALAYITSDLHLVVKDPNGSRNIVATHVVALWPIFDGDVLLYGVAAQADSFSVDLWVYGIAEHKMSKLGVQIGPDQMVF